MARAFLILAGCLVLAAFAAAGSPPMFHTTALFQIPSEERESLTLNLTGTAANLAQHRALAAHLELQGVVARTLPAGPDQTEHGTLRGTLLLLDAAGPVDAAPVEVAYQAQRSAHLSAGMDGWRLSVQGPGFALLGSTTGVLVQDGQAAWLVQAYGPLRDGALGLTLSGTATEMRE